MIIYELKFLNILNNKYNLFFINDSLDYRYLRLKHNISITITL